MATTVFSNANPPANLAASKSDSPESMVAKQLLANTKGFGQVVMVATEVYRLPGTWPSLVPSFEIEVLTAAVLNSITWEAGKEVRNAAGTVVNTLSLAVGKHLLAMTSFTLTSGTTRVALGAPWIV